jgi:hypothetical protein
VSAQARSIVMAGVASERVMASERADAGKHPVPEHDQSAHRTPRDEQSRDFLPHD